MPVATGTDERVRWGADAAGQHDGAVGTLRLVQHLGDANRVGDDGEIGDVDDVVRQLPRRGAGSDADRATRPDRRGTRHRDGVLLAHVAQRLGFETGLVGRAFVAQRRAAVHLQQQPCLVEQVEIAAHGHVADGQKRCQFADANRAAATHLGDDDLVSLTCQHTRRNGVDRTLDHVR